VDIVEVRLRKSQNFVLENSEFSIITLETIAQNKHNKFASHGILEDREKIITIIEIFPHSFRK
jgi:hypothetical protein